MRNRRQLRNKHKNWYLFQLLLQFCIFECCKHTPLYVNLSLQICIFQVSNFNLCHFSYSSALAVKLPLWPLYLWSHDGCHGNINMGIGLKQSTLTKHKNKFRFHLLVCCTSTCTHGCYNCFKLLGGQRCRSQQDLVTHSRTH